ncbi:hypothetical protein F5Y16DRAFT_402456 [Xylariaceae sp. FL0255]|nr:hypothetical protein F5Y16DRAFT_402456 [Xylariaceae sp. FL0255]
MCWTYQSFNHCPICNVDWDHRDRTTPCFASQNGYQCTSKPQDRPKVDNWEPCAECIRVQRVEEECQVMVHNGGAVTVAVRDRKRMAAMRAAYREDLTKRKENTRRAVLQKAARDKLRAEIAEAKFQQEMACLSRMVGKLLKLNIKAEERRSKDEKEEEEDSSDEELDVGDFGYSSDFSNLKEIPKSEDEEEEEEEEELIIAPKLITMRHQHDTTGWKGHDEVLSYQLIHSRS